MRARMVKPDFFKHGELFDAEQASRLPLRLAYQGLWGAADREGRFRWRPRELKLDILPFDDVDFAQVLNALEQYGFIQSYVVDGKRYGRIPTLKTHQHFHPREAASDLPAPPAEAMPRLCLGPDEEPTEPSPGSAKAVANPPASDTESDTVTESLGVFDRAWHFYPKRVGSNPKGLAARAWQARIREGVTPDDMLEGVERYRAHCDAERKTGTAFGMQAARFFGPGREFAEPWGVSDPMPAMYDTDGATYSAAFIAWTERQQRRGLPSRGAS